MFLQTIIQIRTDTPATWKYLIIKQLTPTFRIMPIINNYQLDNSSENAHVLVKNKTYHNSSLLKKARPACLRPVFVPLLYKNQHTKLGSLQHI
jgi:hypothetical protein